jgi:TPR repeat protein
MEPACSPGREFQSIYKAAYDFKLAADQGLNDAQFHHGYCLQNGLGAPLHCPGAAHYFKLSDDQRFARAQFHYGSCLHIGAGVSTDVPGSVEYLKRAADQGDAHAQNAFGLGEHGRGIPMD